MSNKLLETAFKKSPRTYLLGALIPTVLLLGGCFVADSFRSDQASAIAQTESTNTKAVNTPALATVLEKYVDEQGLVDYESLQADRQQLDSYNASIQLLDQSAYDSMSDSEKIALLINAYNSLTLKSIIDESPIKDSIKDITGVWRFNRHGFVGTQQTLNNIEHDILRADFNEPRIHAALVCAAISCPYLRQEPFTGEDLDAQLDDQVRVFLARQEVLEIDKEQGEVRLSAIFDWFGEDWVPSFGPDEGFAGQRKSAGCAELY